MLFVHVLVPCLRVGASGHLAKRGDGPGVACTYNKRTCYRTHTNKFPPPGRRRVSPLTPRFKVEAYDNGAENKNKKEKTKEKVACLRTGQP